MAMEMVMLMMVVFALLVYFAFEGGGGGGGGLVPFHMAASITLAFRFGLLAAHHEYMD